MFCLTAVLRSDVRKFAILGMRSLLRFNPNPAIINNDAGQYKVFVHGLCRVHSEPYIQKIVEFNNYQLVKSPSGLSFRVKREIFILQPIEKIRFLPVVEMTHSMNLTFYEFINNYQNQLLDKLINL